MSTYTPSWRVASSYVPVSLGLEDIHIPVVTRIRRNTCPMFQYKSHRSPRSNHEGIAAPHAYEKRGYGRRREYNAIVDDFGGTIANSGRMARLRWRGREEEKLGQRSGCAVPRAQMARRWSMTLPPIVIQDSHSQIPLSRCSIHHGVAVLIDPDELHLLQNISSINQTLADIDDDPISVYIVSDTPCKARSIALPFNPGLGSWETTSVVSVTSQSIRTIQIILAGRSGDGGAAEPRIGRENETWLQRSRLSWAGEV
ncbi:hypothetical protein FA13DRAFT_1867151 [Coprinellus micaceus]|uniref:Uncharacterized protein n=1 Tax=Coprinellus micaceus TaxID=71717 RepID=A0A4Y7SAA2_COPMI|nr:hypothetical protein FA13DRAFT_1867151 [Coprinellus micaceus]